ncbi:YpoC family protein [Sutcliffiella deserti]|uniref:YpoC family protein n=1 Tax=Sutcliffiella deserti TaxID=2875501 RepID=UPI001CBC9209|nr:hypothetical protein [Sutcliffiella deserti]
MNIPAVFLHPLYYQKGATLDFSNIHEQDIVSSPFKFDIAYSLGVFTTWQPWKDKLRSVPMLFLAWKEYEASLVILHKSRERHQVKKHMTQVIAIFIQSLFWMNGQPVSELAKWQKDVKALRLKPINLEERLDFVMSQPEKYPAFIQIQQLINEIQKLFYKMQAVENLKK